MFRKAIVSVFMFMVVLSISEVVRGGEGEPFGASLFSGHTGIMREDASNPKYILNPGDRIALRIWGAKSADEVLTIDSEGNIFLPDIGPVRVAGLRNADLNQAVRKQVQAVYPHNVEIYTNLVNAQPIGVFVTGFVRKPGHYPGGPADSIIDYLNKAGGIDPNTGSYRSVKVKRNGKKIVSADLYRFLLDGNLPSLTFRDGDTIVVEPKGASSTATGSIKNSAVFEMQDGTSSGQSILELAGAAPGTSHVWVTGARSGSPFNAYLSIVEFSAMQVHDGDKMVFYEDAKSDTIQVKITGSHSGQSTLAVKRTTRLHDVLQNIPINRQLADLKALYIKRKSVAENQKRALDESLLQLEKAILTAPAKTEGEASIRVKEAEMVGHFIDRANAIQPDGRLVVASGASVADINLEDGDEIVIPQKSDVVTVSGEVLMPQAVVASRGTYAKDYIQSAGGFTERANKSKIVIVKPNGDSIAGDNPMVGPGDRILVLPKVETKNLQVATSIMQILYQIAVASTVVLAL